MSASCEVYVLVNKFSFTLVPGKLHVHRQNYNLKGSVETVYKLVMENLKFLGILTFHNPCLKI